LRWFQSEEYGIFDLYFKGDGKRMALAPQKFREIVFQLMYSQDFGGDAESIVPMLMAQLAVTKRVMREACVFRDRLLEKRAEIDAVLRMHSASYELERIPRVERNVIRLGIYELIFVKGIPPKVVIAEAMRLSRKFSTPESATFVNAVLDSIYKELIPKDVETPSGLCV
jgi:transcription antitermination protein NusB